MMTYYNYQSIILNKFDADITKLEDDPKILPLIKQYINDAAEVLYRFSIPWMKKESILALKAKYSTGTLTVTSASATITGVGTVFTRDMKGQKIVITDGTDGTVVYRISEFTDSTHLVLETPYIHTGGAGLTYAIYYDTYTLDKDFKTLVEMKNITSVEYDSTYMLNSSSSSTPSQIIFMGVTYAPYYNTGTITTTSNSATITGIGTSWDSTMVGKYIQIGNYGKIFKITTVSSGTEIILDSVFPTVLTEVKYQINPIGLQQIRFISAPTVAYLIPYTFYPKAPVLYDDTDTFPIPSDTIIILGATWLYQKANEWGSQNQTKTDFEKELARLTLIKIEEVQTNVFPVIH